MHYSKSSLLRLSLVCLLLAIATAGAFTLRTARAGHTEAGRLLSRALAVSARGLGLKHVAPVPGTLTVINTNDSGAGSLRAAIDNAAAGDTINFSPTATGTITLTSGELLISRDLTIDGPGSGVLTISGNHNSRVFRIGAGVVVSIDGVTISEALVSNGSRGAGISNAGSLNLAACRITQNKFADPINSTFGFGGGIYNTGTMTLTDCDITNNRIETAGGGAGGAIASQGPMTLIRCNVTGNSIETSSSANGGAIYNSSKLNVVRCSVSGNTVTGGTTSGGGAIFTTNGPLDVTDSELSGNEVRITGSGIDGANGGGIYSADQIVNVTRSTIANNKAVDGQSFNRGGGIAIVKGTLNLINSTVFGNEVSGAQFINDGGGVYNYLGSAVLISSTVVGNSVSG